MSQIEEKFDTIDEKLIELKLKKEAPDYLTLFSRFEWCRLWFTLAEDALLALAFRGESDQPILDFIRAKIENTDVITFNKFLAYLSIEPIPNHYECLVTQHWGDNVLLNPNKAAVNALLKHYINIKKVSGITLSKSTNSQIVDYLIANPNKIEWDLFELNQNPKAAKFCISRGKIHKITLSSINDDDIVNYLISNPDNISYDEFSQNPNDRAVEYLWSNPLRNQSKLMGNPNERVVDWLLEDTSRITDFYELSYNKNPKVTDYLLQNPQYIVLNTFYINKTDSKIAKYLIDNGYKYSNHYDILALNSSDIAVDYVLNNIKNCRKCYFWQNSNDRALEYLLEYGYDKGNTVFNPCNYNMQKINAFNAAGLFPRLPHLKL